MKEYGKKSILVICEGWIQNKVPQNIEILESNLFWLLWNPLFLNLKVQYVTIGCLSFYAYLAIKLAIQTGRSGTREVLVFTLLAQWIWTGMGRVGWLVGWLVG